MHLQGATKGFYLLSVYSRQILHSRSISACVSSSLIVEVWSKFSNYCSKDFRSLFLLGRDVLEFLLLYNSSPIMNKYEKIKLDYINVFIQLQENCKT